MGVKQNRFTPFCMSKDLNISRLCDVYGALLTDHRREIVRNYYDDDLSLAEIAENFSITRQAALCSIKQAEKQLLSYEAALGVVAGADGLKRFLAELKADCSHMRTQEIEQRLQSFIDGMRF